MCLCLWGRGLLLERADRRCLCVFRGRIRDYIGCFVKDPHLGLINSVILITTSVHRTDVIVLSDLNNRVPYHATVNDRLLLIVVLIGVIPRVLSPFTLILHLALTYDLTFGILLCVFL